MDACFMQGWKSHSWWKRSLADTLASGVNDEAQGWFTKPSCSHTRWMRRVEPSPRQRASSLVITAQSEQQIKWRCTAIHLATSYSLLSRTFTAQWNKTKHTKKFRTTHSVTSEAFVPPKATPPTSVQVFSSLMQSLWKESVQSQGWRAFSADDPGDVA